MVMYSIYNADTIEKLFNTLEIMHNKTTWNERLFWGKLKIVLKIFIRGRSGTLCYKFNSYINAFKEKYNKCMKSLFID